MLRCIEAHIQIINRSVAENTPLWATAAVNAAVDAAFTDELQEVNIEIEMSHVVKTTSNVSWGLE